MAAIPVGNSVVLNSTNIVGARDVTDDTGKRYIEIMTVEGGRIRAELNSSELDELWSILLSSW